MQHRLNKKKGFTLLEIIISMCIISILSVSVYSSYMLIIKIIKSGEEKQQAAIIGKDTLETLKSNSGNNILEFKKSENDKYCFDFNGIDFVQENDDVFENTTYLNSRYEESDKKTAKYIRTTTIEKVKTENNISIDLDEKMNTTEDNDIYTTLNITKKPGKSNEPQIIYGSTKKAIPADYRGNIIIDIYISDYDTGKEAVLKDCQGNILFDGIKAKAKDFNNGREKGLKINLDFSAYKVDSEDELNPIEINVVNKSIDQSYIVLEKSSHLNINCKTLEGNVTYYNNRSSSESSVKLGELYRIKVEIKMINQSDEILFTGYSSENLIFK